MLYSLEIERQQQAIRKILTASYPTQEAAQAALKKLHHLLLQLTAGAQGYEYGYTEPLAGMGCRLQNRQRPEESLIYVTPAKSGLSHYRIGLNPADMFVLRQDLYAFMRAAIGGVHNHAQVRAALCRHGLLPGMLDLLSTTDWLRMLYACNRDSMALCQQALDEQVFHLVVELEVPTSKLTRQGLLTILRQAVPGQAALSLFHNRDQIVRQALQTFHLLQEALEFLNWQNEQIEAVLAVALVR